MPYGVSIIESDGFNFVENYRPYNLIDAIPLTARSGQRAYTMKAGDRLVITETYGVNRTYYGANSGFGISALNGVVTWPVDIWAPMKPGESRVFGYIGEIILVMRAR
ncbi:hypothetical protein ACET9R_18455 [Aeromonas veronii]|uniref:hypothetical protein n=1 Tax=Aeromonas veronii TaxID=654 RepID=UPI002B2CF75F|nr:hypothetical protein VAWG002_43050 [Aeromonas veronii]